MVLISDVDTTTPYSYSERTCGKCSARMAQARDRRGRPQWACTSCGKRAR